MKRIYNNYAASSINMRSEFISAGVKLESRKVK